MSVSQKEQPMTTSSTQQRTVHRPPSKWPEVQHALDEMRGQFGFVPAFVSHITDQALPGTWSEIKNLYFNPHTALEPKLKDAIGLAVASQIPCEMIGYFSEVSALSHDVTPQEMNEAVLMAAITRHWSTILNGSLMDRNEFRKEADQVMAYVQKVMEGFQGQMPPEEAFCVRFSSAQETYKDIEKTLGLVPKFFLLFPEEGISGAWSEFKGLQLNPHTALNGKSKELIGLAVAAQIPCEYCAYFHRAAAKLNGATDKEIQESLAASALARHWSAIFHGPEIDMQTFKQETNLMIDRSRQAIQQ